MNVIPSSFLSRRVRWARSLESKGSTRTTWIWDCCRNRMMHSRQTSSNASWSVVKTGEVTEIETDHHHSSRPTIWDGIWPLNNLQRWPSLPAFVRCLFFSGRPPVSVLPCWWRNTQFILIEQLSFQGTKTCGSWSSWSKWTVTENTCMHHWWPVWPRLPFWCFLLP